MFTFVIPTMWRGRAGPIIRDLNPGEIQSFEDCEYPLSQMLPLLDNHPLVDEIIIINNDDTKCLDWFLNTKWNHVIEINCGKNIYVNPAWELGIKLSKNDRVCLMNDDIWWNTNSNLLETIHPILTENDGCIGLDNNCYFTITSSLEILPLKYSCEEDSWLLGYGCMIFLNKKNHIPCPEQMKVSFGDYWIVKYHLDSGKMARRICNFPVKTNSASTSRLETFNEVKMSDAKFFADIMQKKSWWTYYAEKVPYSGN